MCQHCAHCQLSNLRENTSIDQESTMGKTAYLGMASRSKRLEEQLNGIFHDTGPFAMPKVGHIALGTSLLCIESM